MKNILVAALVLLMVSAASAQLVDDVEVEEASRSNSLGVAPAVTPFSLIDLSRVRWSQSYSVAFFSGGSYSGSMGLYNTNVFYDLSSKLSLSLNLGISHNTGALWGDGNSDASFLPGFVLDYHPSDRFRMTLGFQRYTGYVSPYYYYRPSYWDPFFDH